MLFRKQSRPFDPTGMAVLNLIIGEGYSFSSAEDRIFIPSHGPYYTDSLIVRSNSNVLQRGVDYECLLFHAAASEATVKEVGVAVKILKPTYTGVRIDYQAVGGKYQDLYWVLKDLIDNLGDELINPIRWVDIVGKPDVYNPAAHRHPYWDFKGWDELLTPLDQIINGIHFHGVKKYREVYDYFNAKLGQFNTFMDQEINVVSSKISDNYTYFRDPINRLRIKTVAVNPSVNRDGSWVEVGNRILAFAATPSLLGTTFNISEDIVYPQPDNIILNESDIPILRDDDEWIYQDNQYPTLPGVVEDYDEAIDEQFDLLFVKGYVKTAHGNSYSATVSANKPSLNEGDTVTVTLTTFKFTPGLTVPYAITGIGKDNITVTQYGNVTIGLNGNASFTFTLRPNSPRTDSNVLTVEFAILGGVKISIPYNLLANNTYSARITTVDGLNDVLQTSHTVGDTFYVRLNQHGLSGKTVRLTGLFTGSGQHQLYINNTLATGTNGGYVDIAVTSNGADMYIPVRSVQSGLVDTDTLNFSLSYNSTVLSTTAVPATLLKFTADWIDPTNETNITSVNDAKPFKLRVKHNSNQSIVFNVVVAELTVPSEITPAIPALLYSTLVGSTESNIFVVNRKDRTIDDRLTVKVISPREATDFRTPTITFPAVS